MIDSLEPQNGQVISIANPEAEDGETIHCNHRWRRRQPSLSVLVPTYKDSADQLIAALGACKRAEDIEIIIYDDGSNDPALSVRLRESSEMFPGAACLVTNSRNLGRAAGRNRLEALARADWQLFLDADMVPDDEDFLVRYFNQIEEDCTPRLIVGGFSLNLTPHSRDTDLNRAQSEHSECLPASVRNEHPGRYVFTSNVLAHRHIMMMVPFDPGFSGWGWEDVEWGIRTADQFPVIHIDNTATHLGLDTTENLIRKYESSGENFWRTVSLHPDVMTDTPLYRMARLFSNLPGRGLVRELTRIISRSPNWIAPRSVRLLALKTFRAAVYGGVRNGRA
ncbi:glycosyltransferase family 2 protein [Ponticaulis sp.]|uniref:glycosyltransferase family 2 protein n=1 Tax=Ponticaulis sp. TaxID=2020902 RepID=UPI000B6887E7|nr:glycosyltransferase family 2 protein [Ponticaulis sp.]MAI89703.1 family 2 glycosyl transferase [Ponticaulis sp.]OUY00720.1 MAG: hypothetical protein CBB65_04630 [Hyphomonadaceae bacterium TMED5]|tara:strand:- start:82490 stop:83500 length:1011 start_codon:yes stop_codon:yes gene_type:complete